MNPPSSPPVLRLLAVVLLAGSLLVIAPYAAPLVLAAWLADVLHPLVSRLQRLLRGRRRGAAAVVVLLTLVVLLPLFGLGLALVATGSELLPRILAMMEGKISLADLLGSGSKTGQLSLRDWAAVVGRHGSSAVQLISAFLSASTATLLTAVVFLATLFAFAAAGQRWVLWLGRHSTLPLRAGFRLVRAFQETGRGLIVGSGGTALAQGLVATVAYVALGIPRALFLGPLTALCAIVPFIGTGIVWVPLTVGLFIARDYPRALAVLAVGSGVHALVDNFLRPVLTRYGHLKLPVSVVLVSMLGGVAVWGAVGALLGPLAVRLTVEVLAILRADRQPRPSAVAPIRGL
jgi:predicted PurR-regulated permease PerM